MHAHTHPMFPGTTRLSVGVSPPCGKGTMQWLVATYPLFDCTPSRQAGVRGLIGWQVGCPILDLSPCCTNVPVVYSTKLFISPNHCVGILPCLHSPLCPWAHNAVLLTTALLLSHIL